VPGYDVVTPKGLTKKCKWVSGKPARNKNYCKIAEVRENCARECDSCTDYTIKKTKPPVKIQIPTAAPVPAPTAAPVPAPTAAPVPDPTAAPVRAPVSLDDD